MDSHEIEFSFDELNHEVALSNQTARILVKVAVEVVTESGLESSVSKLSMLAEQVACLGEVLAYQLHNIDRSLFARRCPNRNLRMSSLVEACNKHLLEVASDGRTSEGGEMNIDFMWLYETRTAEYSAIDTEWLRQVTARAAKHLCERVDRLDRFLHVEKFLGLWTAKLPDLVSEAFES